MNTKEVESTIIEVIKEIQNLSGLECPRIDGKTKPLQDIPQFDSIIWPVATSIIADKLNITIPDDVNIFSNDEKCDSGKYETLTLDQIVKKVMGIFNDTPTPSLSNVVNR